MINSEKLGIYNINNWLIYTKSNCDYCTKVKDLLQSEQIIKIINCDNWLKNTEDKNEFLKLIRNVIGYEYKTFPIVFLNDKFIGGYNETKNYFQTTNNNNLILSDDF